MRGAAKGRRGLSTADGAVIDFLELQIEQLDRHRDRDNAWETVPLGKLKLGVLRALNEVVVSLEAVKRGEVVGADLDAFRRACANGANYFAFLAERARRAPDVEEEAAAS